MSWGSLGCHCPEPPCSTASPCCPRHPWASACAQLPAAPRACPPHLCPSTAIMARPQRCCLPAAHTLQRNCGCLWRTQEPLLQCVGQSSPFPVPRAQPPQAETPSHRPRSVGLPPCCWPGRLGSAGACAALALPAPCLCWAEPGVPAAPTPLPPDVPCPHLVTIRSAPRWSPLPAPPAHAAPSPRAGGRCREPLRRPPLHTGAVARAPASPGPCGRSCRPGATGLFFYNNFLVHSNFFL